MIAAILLAAGESRRMGQPKPLLPFRGGTLIEHMARELARSEAGQVVVVLGHEAEHVRATLAGLPVRVAVNDEYRQGMLSSVRRGLRSIPEASEAVLVGPVDQPGLTSGIVNTLIHAWRSSGKGLAVPVYKGRRGHPLLFSARYVPEVLSGFDAVGLRGLLQRHADELLEVPFDDPAVLGDADTPEEYRRVIDGMADMA